MLNCDFEIVSKYADAGLELPVRKTDESAGYDLVAAADTVIPSYFNMLNEFLDRLQVEIQNLEKRNQSLEEQYAEIQCENDELRKQTPVRKPVILPFNRNDN